MVSPSSDSKGNSPDWDHWREALAIALQGQYGTAKTWNTVSEQARDGWRVDAADIMADLPDTPESCGHHSWAGLMALLDEHWPEDIFPTREDDIRRDAGARIISLIRWVDRLRGDAR